jgi:uncharacterized membrane-anchored protein YjiN (DUF445 family)
MIYQFFFINYLLSICIVDVVRNVEHHKASEQATVPKKKAEKFQNTEWQRSISQKIFIILIKLLEALSDKELNGTVDHIVLHRVNTFQEVNGIKKTSQEDAKPAEAKDEKAVDVQ